MKTVLSVLVSFVLSSGVVLAQQTEAKQPDPLAAAVANATAALNARLQALEQRTAASPKVKAKETRESYKAVCSVRGMKLKEAQIDGATGKLTLICQ
jgi:hypothetical protein